MAELEIIDSLGNKNLLKIHNLNDPEKEIYNYCLTKKYDYTKVKDLREQFNKKYRNINSSYSKRKNNNILSTSFRSFKKRSLSERNEKLNNKQYLFPFQIIISKNIKNDSSINFRNRKSNKATLSHGKLDNKLSIERAHDKILSKGKHFEKKEYDKRFKKILNEVIKTSIFFKKKDRKDNGIQKVIKTKSNEKNNMKKNNNEN